VFVKRAVYHSAVWLVFPLWALFVGIAFGRVALLLHYNHEFLAHMQTTEGVVERKWDRLVDHFSNDRIYILVYTYRAGNVAGHVRTGVDLRTYDQATIGGPLPVAYLPSDPRQHSINYPWELSDLDTAPLDDFAVAMAVFLPGALVIGYFAWRNRIHTHLLASGTPVWGEVIDLKKTHTRYGSHSYLVFQFTANGREIKGRTQSLPDTDRTHWQVGDPIQVTYNPKNPGQFTTDIRHALDGALVQEPVPLTHETIWA
jgi:hypothetical protein